MNQERKLTVLIVDDSDVIQNDLKHFFEEYNFKVILSKDGLEGIEKATDFRPDLILLDLVMPNLDGIKMLQVKKVLKEIKEIPVVVLSANTARRNVLAAIEAGAERVISKPYNRETLIQNINEVLNIDLNNFAKTKKTLTDNDNKEIKNRLIEFFLNNYPERKRSLQTAIRNKDKELLKTIVHELKGTGGTIGYPKLTELSREIYERDMVTATDWVFAEFKVNEINQLVFKIEEDFKN